MSGEETPEAFSQAGVGPVRNSVNLLDQRFIFPESVEDCLWLARFDL